MAARQAKSNAEKADRAKDRRLHKKFGISLEEFNRRDAEQRHQCAVCGGPVDAYGPAHVDHFHFKVKIEKHYDSFLNDYFGWDATAYDEKGQELGTEYANTQKAAVKAIKTKWMPWSVRGLLCFKCNKALGYIAAFLGAEANPDILLAVREYLKKRLTKY